MSFPPLPNTISIPALVAGNVLQNDDTSISLIDDGPEGSIVMKTQNQYALMIDTNQRVAINSESFDSQFTINNNSVSLPTLRISRNETFFFDTTVTSNGDVLMVPNCEDIILNPTLTTTIKKNFNIDDHNGVNMGLRLGGQLVTVSASELNYLDVPKGIATENKAIVLDNTKNIIGLNRITANELSGIILTASQPNIRELNNINISNNFSLNGNLITSTSEQINYNNINTPGVAQPLKTLVVDSNREIINLNKVVSNILTGTLSSGPQPNITSLSSLVGLTNNGITNLNNSVIITTDQPHITIRNANNNTASIVMNTSGDIISSVPNKNFIFSSDTDVNIDSHNGTPNKGLRLGGIVVQSSATQLNYLFITNTGVAQASKALVLDNNRNIQNINSLSATSLTGTLQSPFQPNITSVNTLNILSHNGTIGLSLNNILITSSATQINYTNVIPGTASANKCLVVNSNRDISNIRNITASNIEGIITTNIQPNINSVNTLNINSHNGSTLGLSLAGTLVTATAAQINYINTTEGFAQSSKAIVLSSARNIQNINNLVANTLTGTILTGPQPNITSVTTLDITSHNGSEGLKLNGSLITVSANQINKLSVPDGISLPQRVLITNSSNSISGISSLSANIINGTLVTSFQPNIDTVNVLNIKNHNGTTTGLQLNDILVTSNANQLNYVNVIEGIAAGSKALVLSSSGNIQGINTLRASELQGTLLTSFQPNITSVDTLNIINHNGNSSGLRLNNELVIVTAEQINKLNVPDGNAAPNKALIVDTSRNIVNIGLLQANTLQGTLSTASQPNITSVNTLNISNHNGSTLGLSLNGNLVTATAFQLNTVNTTIGTAQSGKALICNNDRNIGGINNLTATNVYGTIQTGNQPGITSVSSLNINNHDGGNDGLRLNNTLVTSTAIQLNYNTVVPGTASALKSMVTDAFNSISNINSLSANSINTQSLNVTGVISSFNIGNIVAKTYSGINFNGRVVNMQLLPSLSVLNFQPANLSDNYSTEFIGYILPQFSETFTFYIQCQSRVRLFVNNQLILHSWTSIAGFRNSNTIFLNANQWVPIYIQFQCDSGATPQLIVQWASSSTTRATINSSSLAWDSNQPNNIKNYNIQNQITLYNSSTSSANTTTFEVDTSGVFTIDASGNNISLGMNDNLVIPSHNGTSSGLILGGQLVLPTASELNYLKVSPGEGKALQALVLDASKNISGIVSLNSTNITCTNLSATNFTISNLTLNGALNNYAVGSLLIRQITGPDVSGRIVNVSTISNLSLINYDPVGLNINYSIDIIGYIRAPFTDTYTFYANADDRCRIFVNSKLLLNIWDTATGLEYTSSTINLTADQWYPIYIQFQNITGGSSLQIRWSSANNLVKSFINSSFMAWDNNFVTIPRSGAFADSITIFSSEQGLTGPQFSSIEVDASGSLLLNSNTGSISVASNTSLNIASHNGTTSGLRLNNVLITASAAEINVLRNVVAGTANANSALVVDGSRNIGNINSLTSTNITGTLLTSSQPNITSIGTLSSTLNSSSDILLTNTTVFRINTDASGSYLQAGANNTTGSSADLYITDFNQNINSSNRKFVIKANTGFLGIQTTTPNRSLTINSNNNNFGLRLIKNNNDGTETDFVDFGTDTGNLNISPSGNNTNILSDLVIGKTNPCTLSINNSNSLLITPTSGCVQIGNTTNNIMPLELGATDFNIGTDTFGFLNSLGATGSRTENILNPFSLRTTGNILVGGSVCVISDKRLKNNINNLNTEKCINFVKNINSVEYTYKNNQNKKHLGFIAQEIYKSEFPELVNLIPNPDIENDNDSPDNLQMNIAYEETIPILTETLKYLLNENKKLKDELSEIKKILNQ